MSLMDRFHDRIFLIRLFQVGFWAGIVIMAIGFAIIIRDLFGY